MSRRAAPLPVTDRSVDPRQRLRPIAELEDFGPDYVLTLQHWRDSFHGKLDQVRALGFDERFNRKWHYYLCYCEAAFAQRHISVVQTLYSRANTNAC